MPESKPVTKAGRGFSAVPKEANAVTNFDIGKLNLNNDVAPPSEHEVTKLASGAKVMSRETAERVIAAEKKSAKERQVTITARIPVSLHDALVDICNAEERTLHYITIKALEQFIKVKKNK